MKKGLTAFALLALMVLVFLGTRYWYTKDSITVTQESDVLLEKIRTVTKLVTVEGQFSEIYDYKDYWKYDLSPFRKQALVRIKGTVSVGYDLNNINIESFPNEKKMVISQVPDPIILSIDHDLSYYDITQGTFNSFTTQDYNKINKNAKLLIQEKAEASELFDAAQKQGNQLLDIVEFMTTQMGWTLEIHSENYPSPTLIPNPPPTELPALTN